MRDEKHDLVTKYHFKTLETKDCDDHHLVLVRLNLNLPLISPCPFSHLCQLSDLPSISPLVSCSLQPICVVCICLLSLTSCPLFWLCTDSSLLIWHLCALSLCTSTSWLDFGNLLIRNSNSICGDHPHPIVI